MNRCRLYIEGLAFWAPTLSGWPLARAALRGETSPQTVAEPVPLPLGLSAAERRRAPVTAALALSAGEAAAETAARQAGELLAVFTSAHGDLPVIDQLCSALAADPLHVSPTRFLHAIHNAPAGLWSMLTANQRNHTAVSAGAYSFAAGLFEAAVLATSEDSPVLLIGYDTAATGSLIHTIRSEGALTVALVLHTQPSPRARFALDWCLGAAPQVASLAQSAAALSLPPNGMSQALPFFESLAQDHPPPCVLALSAHQSLHLWPQALPADTPLA